MWMELPLMENEKSEDPDTCEATIRRSHRPGPRIGPSLGGFIRLLSQLEFLEIKLSVAILLTSYFFKLHFIDSSLTRQARLFTFTILHDTMGSVPASKAFPPGVHVPSLTWFQGTKDQEIDWAVQKQHLQFLVNSNVHGSKSSLSHSVAHEALSNHQQSSSLAQTAKPSPSPTPRSQNSSARHANSPATPAAMTSPSQLAAAVSARATSSPTRTAQQKPARSTPSS